MKHVKRFLNETNELDPYSEEKWEDPNRKIVGYFVAKKKDPKDYLEKNNPKIHDKDVNAIKDMAFNYDWMSYQYGVFTLYDNGDVELTNEKVNLVKNYEQYNIDPYGEEIWR